MEQDINTPKYNTKTGLLTDYGVSLNLPQVNSTVNSVISSDTLNSPATQIKFAERQPLMASDISMADATSPELKIERERIAKEKASQETGISSLMQELGVTQSKEAGYATEQGADIAQQEYDRYASELEAEKRSLELKKRNILANNPTGALRGGQQDLLDNMERDSLSKQADLAILGNASLRRYDTALSIAKRKVESELAPLKAQLDAKKFIYENNQDLFSKAELSKLDGLIKADEKKIADEDKKLTAIENIKLEAVKNGLKDLSGFKDVKTLDEALEVAGSYLASSQNDIIKLDNGSTLLVDKRTGKIVKNFGGVKPTGTTGGLTVGDVNFSGLIGTVSNLETLKAGKEAVAEQMTNYIKNQDWNGAYNQIANTVAQGLPGETKARFENARIDREVLTGFRTALQAYSDAGGDMGLLKGKAEEITRKLGAVKNPELASIAVQLQREFQTYRNVMTGAAFTPAESREYESVNPSSKKSIDLNFAVIDGALNQLSNRVDGTIRAKVPQADDILKLTNVVKTADQAKQEINTLYKTGTPEIITTIENLFNTGKYNDQTILEYLKIKGQI